MSALHDLIRALPPGATLEIHRHDGSEAGALLALTFCVRLPARGARLCGELLLAPVLPPPAVDQEVDGQARVLGQMLAAE